MNEDKRREIKEPGDPGDAQRPPQEINPHVEKKEAPGSDEERPGGPANKEGEVKKKPRLLDEQSEIDDETTI